MACHCATAVAESTEVGLVPWRGVLRVGVGMQVRFMKKRVGGQLGCFEGGL